MIYGSKSKRDKKKIRQSLDPLDTYISLKERYLCSSLFLHLQGMTGRRGPIGVKVSSNGDNTQGSCHPTGQAASAPRGMCQENRYAGFTSSFLPSLSSKFLFSSGSSSCMLLPGPSTKSAVHMPGAAYPLQHSLVRYFTSTCCWNSLIELKHKGDGHL